MSDGVGTLIAQLLLFIPQLTNVGAGYLFKFLIFIFCSKSNLSNDFSLFIYKSRLLFKLLSKPAIQLKSKSLSTKFPLIFSHNTSTLKIKQEAARPNVAPLYRGTACLYLQIFVFSKQILRNQCSGKCRSFQPSARTSTASSARAACFHKYTCRCTLLRQGRPTICLRPRRNSFPNRLERRPSLALHR